MEQKRTLISVRAEFDGDSPVRTVLQEGGFELVEEYGGPDWSDHRTREKLPAFDAIVAGNEKFNMETMADAPRLRIIARFGVGYDRVDVDYCTERGIVVTNTPGAMAAAVADLTFGLLLALIRSIPAGDAQLKAGAKTGESMLPIGEDLGSMTLGLIGCGLIGTEVLARAAGFGMTTLVHDPWADAARIRALGAQVLSLDELLPRADVVSLHLPLTASNEGLVDANFLEQMKAGAYLINTARGGLVDEPALVAALKRGELLGAGLDCQATEPPVGISRELVEMCNVVATPHVGSMTLSARKKMAAMAGQAIVDFFTGRQPAHVVNPEALSRP